MINFLLVGSVYGVLENSFNDHFTSAWRAAGQRFWLGVYPQYCADAAGLYPRSDPRFLGTDPRLNFFCQQFAGHRLLNNRNRRQQVLAH